MVSFPARLTSIIGERNALAPGARGAPKWYGIILSSDGMLGDASHAATDSDHNPDPHGVVHAVDVSQSMPGTPYWDPRCQQFDVFAHIHRIIDDYRSLDPAGRARRYPWLVPGGAPNDGGYMVWFEKSMGVEAIFHPGAGNLDIRSQGRVGHTEHGHFSIGYTAASENDRQPIFGAIPQEADLVMDATTIQQLRDIWQQEAKKAKFATAADIEEVQKHIGALGGKVGELHTELAAVSAKLDARP